MSRLKKYGRVTFMVNTHIINLVPSINIAYRNWLNIGWLIFKIEVDCGKK